MRRALRCCLLATASACAQHRSAPSPCATSFKAPIHIARRAALLSAGTALPTWPQRANAFRFGISTEAPEPNNIFRRILAGEAPADVLDDSNEDLFSFKDINPASTLHYLIIPRRFIRDASVLTPDDAQLVQRMVDTAVDQVKRSVGDEFDEDELVLGFHWPPFYSVPWLHLHAIYPRSQMRRRYKYTPISFFTPSRVLRRLSRDKA